MGQHLWIRQVLPGVSTSDLSVPLAVLFCKTVLLYIPEYLIWVP